MLLEIAIGDAYGAAFEFVPVRTNSRRRTLLQEFVKRADSARSDLARYHTHPRHRIAAGSYTDDTQMSLALAELLVSRAPFTREALADKFVEVFHRDPREGYARGFHAFLRETRSGKDFLANIRPDSKKSGAAMRAAPLGVLATPRLVMEHATLQARLTHDTKEGIDAAMAAALVSHYFLYALGPRSEVARWVNEHVPGRWQDAWTGEVGGGGIDCVHAAIDAIGKHDTLSTILRACVGFGGDVDTVAAIAMGGASHARDIRADLPDALVTGLENGPFGRDYLIALDAKLLEHVRAST